MGTRSRFATLYLVSIGGQGEANLSVSSLPSFSEMTSDADTEENLAPNFEASPLDDTRLEHPHSEPTNPTRLLSCFRRGFLIILASAIKGIPLPRGRFSLINGKVKS